MKKALIAILAVLVLATGICFAKGRTDNYSSLDLGVGYAFQTFTYNDIDTTRTESDIAMNIQVRDYTIINDKMGVYADFGGIIPLSHNVKVNDAEKDQEGEGNTNFTVGFAYKAKAGKMDLLLGVGPEFAFYSKKTSVGGTTIEASYFTMGVGFSATAVVDLGSGFYFGASAKASVYFLNKCKVTTSSGSHTSTSDSSPSSYFGFRIQPQIGIGFNY